MLKRRKFSAEFKQSAIEQIRQPGVGFAQIARALGISVNLLSRSKRKQGSRLPRPKLT